MEEPEEKVWVNTSMEAVVSKAQLATTNSTSQFVDSVNGDAEEGVEQLTQINSAISVRHSSIRQFDTWALLPLCRINDVPQDPPE